MQCRIIKEAITTALLNPGRTDFTVFIDDQQDQRFTFQPLGNSLCRVELTTLIQFPELALYLILPVSDASRGWPLLDDLWLR